MAEYKGKPVPQGLEDNTNFYAFRDMEEAGQLEQFAGKHLAFVEGRHALTEASEEALLQKLQELYPAKGSFIKYVPLPGEEVPVVRFRSPRVVRNQR